MNKFFIFDCTGAIVGNPAGYRTMRGAMVQAEKPRGKAYKAIWEAYDKAKALNPEHNFIHAIKPLNEA